jgi:hypothetical protein
MITPLKLREQILKIEQTPLSPISGLPMSSDPSTYTIKDRKKVAQQIKPISATVHIPKSTFNKALYANQPISEYNM